MPPSLSAAVPVLPVRDTRAAAQFYERHLGFAVDYLDDGYAILVRSRVAIHLWAAKDDAWQGRAGDTPVVSGAETFLAGTASCRIHVDGIDALCDIYRAAGVLHPNGPLSDKPYGLREFAILDLDGNLITFFQRIP
jgi:catechol 2,3-dioxygenase-like lactoylglutathione lyase family enzyme